MVDDYKDRLTLAMKEANMSPTALAKALKVSYQAVRKVLLGGRLSMENNAAAAKVLGVTSDWLATGKGEQRPTGAAPKGSVFSALTVNEQELIEHWRHLLPSDRKDAMKKLAALAKERMAQREELLEEAGLGRIAEKAANATRSRPATTQLPINPRLKQRSLLEDE